MNSGVGLRVWRACCSEFRCQIVSGECMLLRCQVSDCEWGEDVVRIQVSDYEWREHVVRIHVSHCE